MTQALRRLQFQQPSSGMSYWAKAPTHLWRLRGWRAALEIASRSCG